MTRGAVTITTHPSLLFNLAEQSNKTIVAVGLPAGEYPILLSCNADNISANPNYRAIESIERPT